MKYYALVSKTNNILAVGSKSYCKECLKQRSNYLHEETLSIKTVNDNNGIIDWYENEINRLNSILNIEIKNSDRYREQAAKYQEQLRKQNKECYF